MKAESASEAKRAADECTYVKVVCGAGGVVRVMRVTWCEWAVHWGQWGWVGEGGSAAGVL